MTLLTNGKHPPTMNAKKGQVPQPSLVEFTKAFQTRGWCLFDGYLDSGFTDELAAELDAAYESCRKMRREKGLSDTMNGALHHLILFRGGFLDLLKIDPLHEYIRSYFVGNYILSCYNAVINEKASSSYVAGIHRDTRLFTEDLNLVINMLVMLDDFTLANGATYVLSGSHLAPERPTDETFFAKSDRLVGKKGSIVLFNSNVWHAAGKNTTDEKRRCLTLTYSRPWLKQQLDYPRALGYELADQLPENLLQVLGYNSRIPASFDEWYQPPEKRFYRLGQDL